MLEKYEQNFDENDFVKSFMVARNFKTKKEALAALRKEIKKESYYQERIKKALKAKYPEAFIVKISQSLYSQAGIPDILMIYNGHYFGFEVKRPVVGIPSKLQEETIRKITAAGGTALFVRWPEEAIQAVNQYDEEDLRNVGAQIAAGIHDAIMGTGGTLIENSMGFLRGRR